MRPTVLVLASLAAAVPPVVLGVPVVAAPPESPTLTREQIRDTVVSSMDKSADPCEDFYRYSCGGWLDATKLPADQPRWSRSFSVIAERNREIVRDLLEAAAKDPGPVGEERQQIGDLFAGCMDESALAAAGTRPLQPLFATADAVHDPASLLDAAGQLSLAGVSTLFGAGALADFKNPKLSLYFMIQGGLGLPDRDYYVSDDPKKKEILVAYEKHVARALGMVGEGGEQAAADARAIVAFETELAKASRPRADLREREKLYNKIDRAGLEKLTPALPWSEYFDAIGTPSVQSINVAVPEFFQTLERLARETPLPALRAYLRWQIVNQKTDFLAEPFAVADYEFFDKALSGQAEIQPRWKRCVDAANTLLGEALGKLYVESQFAGASKAVALEMIGDIERAFDANLPELAWMDDVTRQRAAEKAHKVANKIGYPDVWRDYSKVKVSRGDYFASAQAAQRFEVERDLAKVEKPVDKTEWLMNAHRVNAYYLSTQNEIVFPAGILQPPFFHQDYPAAMNYGGIGGVIGHELTHGFDDQGRKSDGDGVLQEWWQPEVAKQFEAAAQCVDDQYSSFEVEPGVKVSGKLTLGEDIADLGGLTEAFDAFQAWKTRHGAPEPLVPGLTPEQLFFVAYGQVWCTVTSPEYLRRQVTTDVHAPGMLRAVGAPRNSVAFRQAFGCAPGDKMVAEPTCTVW